MASRSDRAAFKALCLRFSVRSDARTVRCSSLFLNFAAFLCAPNLPAIAFPPPQKSRRFVFLENVSLIKAKARSVSLLAPPFSVDSPLGRVLSRSLSPVQVPFEVNIFLVHSNNIFSIFCLIVYVKCCFSLNIVSSIVFLFFFNSFSNSLNLHSFPAFSLIWTDFSFFRRRKPSFAFSKRQLFYFSSYKIGNTEVKKYAERKSAK